MKMTDLAKATLLLDEKFRQTVQIFLTKLKKLVLSRNEKVWKKGR